MTLRQTHTYATLEISRRTYDEIKNLLKKAGYDHVFHDDLIDMHGIALKAQPLTSIDEALQGAQRTSERIKKEQREFAEATQEILFGGEPVGYMYGTVFCPNKTQAEEFKKGFDSDDNKTEIVPVYLYDSMVKRYKDLSVLGYVHRNGLGYIAYSFFHDLASSQKAALRQETSMAICVLPENPVPIGLDILWTIEPDQNLVEMKRKQNQDADRCPCGSPMTTSIGYSNGHKVEDRHCSDPMCPEIYYG